jgi:hypothetical protein
MEQIRLLDNAGAVLEYCQRIIDLIDSETHFEILTNFDKNKCL